MKVDKSKEIVDSSKQGQIMPARLFNTQQMEGKIILNCIWEYTIIITL